jgi:small subunit ribosomal protein S8e
MTKWHIDTGRKVTGGKIHLHRKKRRFQRGSLPLLTRLGKEKKRIDRRRGGIKKIRFVETEFANVMDPKTHKTKKVKILDILRNEANPQYVRRSIITKGTIIKTELGEAKVVSRPSQEGVVNATIVPEKKEEK